MACAVLGLVRGVVFCGQSPSSSVGAVPAGKGVRAHCLWSTSGSSLQLSGFRRKPRACEDFSEAVSSWKIHLSRRTARSNATQDQQGILPDDMDSKFVPINELEAMGEEGPAAMLLLGFSSNEVATLMEMLREMDGDFMKVLCCTPEMLRGSLEQAMAMVQKDPLAEKAVEGVPRVCFLSGLSSEEIMMIIDAYEQTDLEQPAFAAMVPKNKDKLMEELIAEVMGDHNKLTSNTG